MNTLENRTFNLCVSAAQNKKALDIIALDLKGISSFADYFIVCSGSSHRRVQAIATSIEMDLKKEGMYALGIEGFNEGNWILLDYGDVVIHVFYQPFREFYDLERLWADARRIELGQETEERTQ